MVVRRREDGRRKEIEEARINGGHHSASLRSRLVMKGRYNLSNDPYGMSADD